MTDGIPFPLRSPFRWKVAQVTGDTTLDYYNVQVIFTGGSPATINLPTAAGASGFFYEIKNASGAQLTIDAAGSETIEGALTYVSVVAGESVTITSDGTNWRIAELPSFASTIMGGAGSITVKDTGVIAINPATSLNFVGATVADAGAGQANITITATGGVGHYQAISVSSSGDNNVTLAAQDLSRSVYISAVTGIGPYTANIILPTSSIFAGCRVIMRMEVAASTNPTIKVYNDNSGGTLLLTVAGIASTTSSVAAEFYWNGSAWVLLYAGYDN